jgi:hypothetical protein
MAAGRGSDELQLVLRPMIMVSSPESRKKGTILRNFGVLEIFIFIFIFALWLSFLQLSAVFISIDMRDKYIYYSQ